MPGHYTNTTGIAPGLNARAADVRSGIDALDDQIYAILTGGAGFQHALINEKLELRGGITLDNPTTLTIASDSITPTKIFHKVDTEGGNSADNLSSILATSTRVLFLIAASAARNVTLKHGVGNLLLPSGLDVALKTDTPTLLIYNGTSWAALSSSSGGLQEIPGVAGSYLNANVTIDIYGRVISASDGAAGGGASDSVDVLATAGENLSYLDAVFLDSSDKKWRRVDIDAPAQIALTWGFVIEAAGIATDATGLVRVSGKISGFSGLTPWQEVFLSATPGTVTQIRPEPIEGGNQVCIVRAGFATSSTTLIKSGTEILFLKRKVLADDEILTIEHCADAGARTRSFSAYLSGMGAGSTLSAYASSNVDAPTFLRCNTPITADLTSPATTITASSSLSGSSASKAINDVNAIWSDAWLANNTTTGWLLVDFGIPTRVDQLTMDAPKEVTGRAPKNFTVQGSHDNTSWITLHTVSNQTAWTAVNTFNFVNAVAYRYYKVDITANNGDTLLGVGEMQMKRQAEIIKDKLAQSFQLSSNRTIYQARLWLRKVGLPTGILTLRVETDNAGSPSGTLVHANATATVAESSLSTSCGWVEFDFNGFLVAGSTPYWLVLSTDRTASGDNYVDWGADAGSPSYASGEMKAYTVSSWSAEGKDFAFEVLAPGVFFETPLLAASWNSGLAEVEIVSGDESGADRDTKSTLRNTKGVGADVTFLVRTIH